MKKLLFVPILFLAILAHGQSLCLRPLCKPIVAHVGDTGVYLGAELDASRYYTSIIFKQLSGPNTSTITYVLPPTSFSGLAAQQWVTISGTAPGTYVYQIIGSGDGGTVYGTDTLIVQPAIAACPPARTVTGIQVSFGGVMITIPIAACKFTFSDGTTQ